MALTVVHNSTNNISDWTQGELDAQIALGNYPPGTLLADITKPSDWNANHTVSGTIDPSQNDVTTANSILGDGTAGSPVTLDGDEASPGNSQYYGTDAGGAKGFYNLPAGGTVAFDDITSGTNTGAAMVVDTGASIAPSGTGTITATAVVAVDAGGDTTTFPILAGAATGSTGPLTDAGFTYNATTNALTTTTFIGALTGNSSTATALATARAIGGVNFDGTAAIVPQTIQVVDAGGDTTTFIMLATAATGDLQPATDAGLSYNATTNALTTTTFIGALTGNATTVTTNANLTGPITSVGNATSVAAQTGTGSTFVMQASPTLTTPNIGVATGTSLDVSGVLESGANGGTQGQLTLLGSTSGSVAIKTAAAAGTGTIFQLPADNGTNNYVLQTNGSGVTSWVAPSAGGATNIEYSTQTTNFTVVLSGDVPFYNVTLSAADAMTLPSVASNDEKWFYVVNNLSSSDPLTVTFNGGDTGSNPLTGDSITEIAIGETYLVVADGGATNWVFFKIISKVNAAGSSNQFQYNDGSGNFTASAAFSWTTGSGDGRTMKIRNAAGDSVYGIDLDIDTADDQISTLTVFSDSGATIAALAADAGAPYLYLDDGTNNLTLGPATLKKTVGFSSLSPTTGQQGSYVVFPSEGKITAWNIVVDAGTATVEVWKQATGTSAPTSGDSINTSGVSISSGTAIRSTTLSDFTTTTVLANDIFAFDLTAVSGATKITFQLEIMVTE